MYVQGYLQGNENGRVVMIEFNIGPYGNFTFSSFFLKPQNRFESNLAEMFIVWSYTRFLFLAVTLQITLYVHSRNSS
jgi:hypothetical protein